MEEEKDGDEVRFVIVERCIDLPKEVVTSGTRVSKCEECKQDVWVSKASDSYMNKYSGKIINIVCRPCWHKMDKEYSDVTMTEETLKDFDEWCLKHYGHVPTREQTFEMVKRYIGKRQKIRRNNASQMYLLW